MKQLAMAILLPLALGLGAMVLYMRSRPEPAPTPSDAPSDGQRTENNIPQAPVHASTNTAVQTNNAAATTTAPQVAVAPAPIDALLVEKVPPREPPTVELLAYKPKSIAASPIPAIPELVQGRLAEQFSTLKNDPNDKDALLGVVQGLVNFGLFAHAVPSTERYLNVGGQLSPSGLRSYARGLSILHRFDEAVALLKNQERDSGGFTLTGADEVTVHMDHCIYACLVSHDIVEACQEFVAMNSCQPNGYFLDNYDMTCGRLCDAVFHAAATGTLKPAFKQIDCVWPFLPSSVVRDLAENLKRTGVVPSPAMQNACDDLNKNQWCSPAAFMRRSQHVWARERNFENGMILADRALQLARQQTDKIMLLEALWCEAGVALQRGELEKLNSSTTEAERLAKELGHAGRIARGAVKMGRMCEQLGDFKGAAEQYMKALVISDKNNETWYSIEDPKTFLNYVRCFLGQAGEVDAYMKQQADGAERTSMGPGARCLPYYNLGICLSRQKKYDEAIRAFRRSMESNDFDYRTLSSIETGRDYLALNNPQLAEAAFADAERYEKMITNCETRWAWQFGLSQAKRMQSDTNSAQTWLDEALKTIEAQRASVKDYNSRRTMQDNKYGVYELAIELALGRKDERGVFALAERSRARTFLDALGAQADKVRAASPADLPTVQAACKDFAAVIYFQCKSSLLVWIVRADSSEMISLPLTEQKLTRAIQQFHVSMLPEDTQATLSKKHTIVDWKTVAQSMYRDIWEPVNKKLRAGERVCIIPHRELHYIPFQALHDGQHFLIEGRDIFYAPSGSGLVALAAQRRVPANEMAVFDPIRSPDINSPFHNTEGEAIGRLFPSAKITTGKDATVAAFKNGMTGAGIIHISSHGCFDPWIPSRSGLLFATTESNDGALRASDVLDLKLKGAPLVVMSACVSSVGDLAGGDEVTGMTRAFQVAGAQNVIGSLWSVDNSATTRLMGLFYEELKQQSGDPTAALCKAQRRFLATSPAPSGWAAFEVNGTGKQ